MQDFSKLHFYLDHHHEQHVSDIMISVVTRARAKPGREIVAW